MESYITFEPGLLEQAIKMNAPGGTHNKLGLSNKTKLFVLLTNRTLTRV